MARQLRIEYPGAIYHVTSRMIGDHRLEYSQLFVDDHDRQRFMDRLAERVEQYNVRLYLFVLMTNHFHLVFETPEANGSRFMQSLSTAYTVYYNRRHARHGHLLDGRYKAKVVEGDEYLLALSRYVHQNPVQVGDWKEKPLSERVEALRGYAWSSYRSYIGQAERLPFVDYGPMLAVVGGPQRDRTRRYREFVESGLAETDEEFLEALRASPRSIGSDGFRTGIDRFYLQRVDHQRRPEDAAFRRGTEPLSPETILQTAAKLLDVAPEAFRQRRRNGSLRAVAATMLTRFGGLTQRQAAWHLGMGTGSAASAQVRRLPGLLAKSRQLRRRVADIEEQLERLKGI